MVQTSNGNLLNSSCIEFFIGSCVMVLSSLQQYACSEEFGSKLSSPNISHVLRSNRKWIWFTMSRRYIRMPNLPQGQNASLHLVCIPRSETFLIWHNGDVIMGAIASQITSLSIVYSTVYSDADQRKHQSSASLVFVWGIHQGPVNSPHKWPVTRKMFPFDDVIMNYKSSPARTKGLCNSINIVGDCLSICVMFSEIHGNGPNGG